MLFFQQAAELAEFTAKIALLEDAKRKKEDEATEWQHKVIYPLYVIPCVRASACVTHLCMLAFIIHCFYLLPLKI